MPTSLSWLAFYLYSFLIGLITASLRAPAWAIIVLFAGLIIVHSLALREHPPKEDSE